MSHNFFFEGINLQLFAEGNGGDSGTGANGANGVNAGVPSLPTKGAKNPLADVKYGIQEDAPAAEVQSKPDAGTVETEDRVAKFEALIKGEFKDLYDARVQDTIQKRFKETKETKETVAKYNELTPILEMLARKYGVDASDIKALNKAIEDDDAYYEEEAMEKGVTVEQLKSIRKMERENAELKKQMEEKSHKERAERDVAEWMKQAEQAKRSFPNLDLGEELKNPEFINLLKSGVGVETAYFAMHHRELVPQAMQYTAKAVEEKLTNKVIANGARPTENGITSQASVVVKSDVSQLSKADRAEIIRRVARGEKIKF